MIEGRAERGPAADRELRRVEREQLSERDNRSRLPGKNDDGDEAGFCFA